MGLFCMKKALPDRRESQSHRLQLKATKRRSLNSFINKTGQQAAQPAPLSVDPSSEFLQAVDGKDSVQVFAIMDDLMDTLRATAPRVYDHIMRKVKEL